MITHEKHNDLPDALSPEYIAATREKESLEKKLDGAKEYLEEMPEELGDLSTNLIWELQVIQQKLPERTDLKVKGEKIREKVDNIMNRAQEALIEFKSEGKRKEQKEQVDHSETAKEVKKLDDEGEGFDIISEETLDKGSPKVPEKEKNEDNLEEWLREARTKYVQAMIKSMGDKKNESLDILKNEAWQHYNELQNELLAKEKERAGNIGSFLEAQRAETKRALEQAMGVKRKGIMDYATDNFLTRAYTKLGEVNIYNYLQEKKITTDQEIAKLKTDSKNSEANGLELGLLYRMAKTADSSRMAKIVTKAASLRTVIGALLGGVGVVEGAAFTALTLRAGMGMVGGVATARGAIDAYSDAQKQKELGYQGGVFASREEAEAYWKGELGFSESDPESRKKKKIKELDKKMKHFKEVSGKPEEQFNKLQEIVDQIKARALVKGTDWTKDAFCVGLIEKQRALFAASAEEDYDKAHAEMSDDEAVAELQNQQEQIMQQAVTIGKEKSSLKKRQFVSVVAGIGIFKGMQYLRNLWHSDATAAAAPHQEVPVAHAPELKEHLPDLMKVQKGEGITQVIARQLEANPHKYGFQGDSHSPAFKTWLQKESFKIYRANESALVSKLDLKLEDGQQIGLRLPKGHDTFVQLTDNPDGTHGVNLVMEKGDVYDLKIKPLDVEAPVAPETSAVVGAGSTSDIPAGVSAGKIVESSVPEATAIGTLGRAAKHSISKIPRGVPAETTHDVAVANNQELAQQAVIAEIKHLGSSNVLSKGQLLPGKLDGKDVYSQIFHTDKGDYNVWTNHDHKLIGYDAKDGSIHRFDEDNIPKWLSAEKASIEIKAPAVAADELPPIPKSEVKITPLAKQPEVPVPHPAEGANIPSDTSNEAAKTASDNYAKQARDWYDSVGRKAAGASVGEKSLTMNHPVRLDSAPDKYGVSLWGDYEIVEKIVGTGKTFDIKNEAKLFGFIPGYYVKDSSDFFGHLTDAKSTDAEAVLKNLYVHGKILESLSKDSTEYKGLLSVFRKEVSEWESKFDGKGRLQDLPGLTLVQR